MPGWPAPCLTLGRRSALRLSLRNDCRNNIRLTVPGIPIIPKCCVYQSCTLTGSVTKMLAFAFSDPSLWASGRRQMCSLSLTPLLARRGHFNTAAFACRVIVVGKYATTGLQLAASVLCCSTSDSWVYISHHPLWQ